MLIALSNTDGRRRRRRGFTLVELLIGLIIVAILSAVAIPLYLQRRNDSEASTTRQSAEQMITAGFSAAESSRRDPGRVEFIRAGMEDFAEQDGAFLAMAVVDPAGVPDITPDMVDSSDATVASVAVFGQSFGDRVRFGCVWYPDGDNRGQPPFYAEHGQEVADPDFFAPSWVDLEDWVDVGGGDDCTSTTEPDEIIGEANLDGATAADFTVEIDGLSPIRMFRE